MLDRTALRAVAVATTVAMASAGAVAFDETRYPDWSGQWMRPPGVGFQWDATKPPGLAQQAPLTPEYQTVLEASLADQAAGGQGGDNLVTCRTNGMPRMMSALEVETRNFKGPRTYEPSGIPLHGDNESVILERIYLDKADPDIMHNDITAIDHALTRPWTVNKRYRRERNVIWYEDNCTENNRHIIVGKEAYFLSADGYLMPTRKDQVPPDLRYFKSRK